MKKNIKLLIVLVLALFTFTACTKVELKDGKKVIAKTEKLSITAEDLFDEMKEKYALTVILDMIDEKLLASIYTDKEAQKAYVNSNLEQMKYYYESYMQEQYSSFLEFIYQSYGFKDEKALKDYYSLAYLKDEATKDHSKTMVTDKEIKKYYDEKTIGDMKASHILIQADYAESDDEETKEKAKADALKLANELIEQLDEGAKFEDLAKKHSKDSSASKGGDLDWFSEGEMTKAFEEATVKLKTNEYTKEAVETEYGYHIILKTGQKAKAKLSEVKSSIIDKLAEEKRTDDENITAKALITLRKKYGIEIKDTALNKQYKTYVSKIQN